MVTWKQGYTISCLKACQQVLENLLGLKHYILGCNQFRGISPPLMAAPLHKWQTILTVLMQAQNIKTKVVGTTGKKVMLPCMGPYKPGAQLQMACQGLQHVIPVLHYSKVHNDPGAKIGTFSEPIFLEALQVKRSWPVGKSSITAFADLGTTMHPTSNTYATMKKLVCQLYQSKICIARVRDLRLRKK